MEVDLLTVTACVSLALISAALVYLGSVFVIKEKTYDEAIEEQRRKTFLDFGGDIKGGGKKSEKDKKSKKDKKDKDKDKDKDKKKKKNDAVKGGGDKSKPVALDKESGKSAKVKVVEKKETNVPITVASSGNVQDEAGTNVAVHFGSSGKSEKSSPSNQVKGKSSDDATKPVILSKISADSGSQGLPVPEEGKNKSSLNQPVSPSKKKVNSTESSPLVRDTVDQKKGETRNVNTSGTGNQKAKSGKKSDNVEPASSQATSVGVSSVERDGLKVNTGKESKVKQGVEGTGIPVNESKKEAGDLKPVKESKNRETRETKQHKESSSKDGRDALDATSKEASVNRNVNGLSAVEEPIKSEEAKVILASPGKKAKKSKGPNKPDSDELSFDLPFKQLIEHVNNHPFDNEEIQLLINVLLGKQSGESNQWKKKHDPMETVKEQLHEREQEVATLSQNLQASRARMKELRLDLEREKSSHAMTRDKLAQHGTELNNLRNSLQQALEQQRLEAKVLQGKLKEQDSDLQARHIALQRLKEENVNLKMALQQMEAERANLESIPRLQHEIDRLRSERGQMERHSKAIQQNNEELLRNIDKMSEQIQSLTTAKQNDEYSLKKKLNELQDQLRQHDIGRAALLDDLKSAVDKRKQIEQEKQLVEKKSEEELNNLREQTRELEREKERLKEASNSKASYDEEKDGIIRRLKEEINNLNNERAKYEEELRRVNQTVDLIKEELEQVKKESQVRINEARLSSEEQLKKELDKYIKDKESLDKQLIELDSVKSSLEAEKARLRKLLLSVNQQEDDISKSLENLINELTTLKAEKADNSHTEHLEKQIFDLKNNLTLEQEKLSKAQSEAEKFKDALSKTDDYLKELEQKSKEAFEQSSCATKECQRLQELLNKLEQDKLALESKSSQVDNLKETIKNLQAKIDELQQKLDDNSSNRESKMVVEMIQEEPAQENGNKEESNGKVDEVNEETDIDEARLTTI